jgi:hypothetical protein
MLDPRLLKEFGNINIVILFGGRASRYAFPGSAWEREKREENAMEYVLTKNAELYQKLA